ncbi:MAG: hypothetical protein WC437_02135 [Patescibacteria group bacterium]|nr:hypothetical protein [Patescibacteria group bacterium]
MTPSWDLFIILFFVIMTVYGLLLGRGRVFNILINTYVGYVVATELGNFVYDYALKASSISHSISISLFGVKLLVFALTIFILTMRSELAGANDDASTSSLYTAGYGFLAAGLMLSSVISFLPEADRINLFNNSQIAAQVFDYRYFWLIGPIAIIAIGSIAGRLFRK